LSTGQRIEDISISLSFRSGPPTNADDNPIVKDAIGRLHFHKTQEETDLADGWVSLSPDDVFEVWDQVRHSGYDDCRISIDVGPVDPNGHDWVWDVDKNEGAYIETASLEFVRHAPVRQNDEQPKRRRRFFG
jgi:hypothetical protein